MKRIAKKLIPVLSSKGIEATHLKVEVYYHLGGMNYFAGAMERRGLYISVSPVVISKGDGYTSESFIGFSGVKEMILEMARYNEKKCTAFDASGAEKRLTDYICKKYNIELKPFSDQHVTA